MQAEQGEDFPSEDSEIKPGDAEGSRKGQISVLEGLCLSLIHI